MANPGVQPACPKALTKTQKPTAPYNIDLNENEGNILPNWTCTVKLKSSKQTELGSFYLISHVVDKQFTCTIEADAMGKEVESLQKKLKQLQKSTQQLKKSLYLLYFSLWILITNIVFNIDSHSSNNTNHDASNKENGFESEEADPPSGKGFFTQQVWAGRNFHILLYHNWLHYYSRLHLLV